MSEQTGLLQGRRGLIVGVSSKNSVGFHCARNALRHGAQVAVTYRPVHRERGISTAESLGAASAFAYEARDGEAAPALIAELGRTWDSLDFLVHTVAHVPDGALTRPLLEATPAEFESVLAVSVHSLISLCHAALPLLARSDSPRVLTLTSAGEKFVIPHYHLLGIAKAALAATVRYLAADLGPYGILCNALSFPLVPTDGALRAVGPETAGATLRHFARRAMTAAPAGLEDIAEMVAALCSPTIRSLTGQTINQDSGISLIYLPASPTPR